jgi:SecD/SecF fusion protein
MLHTLLAQAAEAPVAWYEEGWFKLVAVLAILVVPYLLGAAIARRLRMADYGWKIGIILVTLTAGVAIDLYGAFLTPDGIRRGIDLQGGVKLIYEIDRSKLRTVNVAQLIKTVFDEATKAGGYGKKKVDVKDVGDGRLEIKLPSDDPDKAQKVQDAIAKLSSQRTAIKFVNQQPTDGGLVLTYQVEHSTADIKMDLLISGIIKRVNPGGQREVAIRQVGGDQIEVAIPQVDKAEIEAIKKKISTAGQLRFRIVADRNIKDHEEAIKFAEEDIKNPSNDVSNGEEIIAEWADATKDAPPQPSWVTRTINGKQQVLVIRDPYDVDGDGLTAAGLYGADGWTVTFHLPTDSARRFGELTGNNLADPRTGQQRELGIVLDGELKSAANIRSRITDSGEITGRFTEEQMNFTVDVLNAGALPAALQKEPVSEQAISAELGADTIRNSALSMIVSTAAVLVFMLFYYRFAGIVANAAVILNLVLVLALMIIFKAAFTLAGLAGLVLSVGMAVDSNVLIYERMREEKERGAALRMVIRNGFGRAMATIIDTHSTTIITGIILYAIGTEQLRGFAVTLVMGLVVNLFTAVFCARVVFDIAERQRWLTELKMLKLFGDTNIDFVAIMKPAIVVSILIAAAGIAALFARGKSILDVDFTGGSEVQIALNPKDAMDVSDVRKALEKPEVEKVLPDVTVNAVTSSKEQENTQFIIRTSNDKIKDVEGELAKVFGERLRHYKVGEIGNQHAIEAKAPAPEPPAIKALPGAETSKGTSSPPTAPSTPAGKSDQLGPGKDAAKADAEKPKDDKANAKQDEPPKTDDTKKAAPDNNKSSYLRRLNRDVWALALPDALLIDDQAAATGSPASKSAKPDAPDPKSQSPDSKSQDSKSAGSSKAEDTKAEPPDASKSGAAKVGASQTDTSSKTDGKSAAATTTGTATPTSPEPRAPSAGAARPSPEEKDLTTRPSATSARDPFAGGTEVTLNFDDPIKYDSLKELLEQTIDVKKVLFGLSNPDYAAAPNRPYKTWTLKLSVPMEEATAILNKFRANIESTPVFLADSTISGRVAGDTQLTALYALIASMVMIVIYIWIRFQNVIYGIGAIVATVHDVLITVAGVALSYYLAGALGFLLVDPFKISLNVVAALLTIVGYSISDTIVIFDRIREVRGKSPDLTEEMINKSVNQTLSRTVLTVFTVLLVTVILYIAGGQAIHAFAFTMLIGLISGTYSSVYIAAPCLLWLKLPSGQNNK